MFRTGDSATGPSLEGAGSAGGSVSLTGMAASYSLLTNSSCSGESTGNVPNETSWSVAGGSSLLRCYCCAAIISKFPLSLISITFAVSSDGIDVV